MELSNVRGDLATNLLKRKMAQENWNPDVLPPEKIKNWCEKLNEHMYHYTSLSILQFQLDELIHYLTIDDILNGIIPSKSEHSYVIALYKQQSDTEVQSGVSDIHKKLQSPDITFGQILKSAACLRCKHETTLITAQKRSPDEPQQYFHQCKNINCRFQWKEG